MELSPAASSTFHRHMPLCTSLLSPPFCRAIVLESLKRIHSRRIVVQLTKPIRVAHCIRPHRITLLPDIILHNGTRTTDGAVTIEFLLLSDGLQDLNTLLNEDVVGNFALSALVMVRFDDGFGGSFATTDGSSDGVVDEGVEEGAFVFEAILVVGRLNRYRQV